MIRDNINKHIDFLNDTVDYLEIFSTYLQWIVDNCDDDKLEEIKLNIQEITQTQSIRPHKINSFKKLLDALYTELEINNDIEIERFDKISERIKNKINK